jgi:signal transduction histidine kinase
MKNVESLKKANEFKSEILSIAAHDLKNPLNTIMGLSGIMAEEAVPPEETMKMADLMKRSSVHMLELITQLLESSIAEFGKLELKRSEVDIAALLTSIVNGNRKASESKKQTITMLCETAEGCIIQADNIKLREALDNIVNNAVKYSCNGGKIEVRLSEAADRVHIEIQDEGPGFTDEDKKKVFGKFQRLSAKPTGGETSTGLGLYIVKQIIELHNGLIDIESQEGKGSIIIIDLPKN